MAKRAKLSAQEKGYLGACKRFPQTAWGKDGITKTASTKLERIATKMCGISPGRPAATATRTMRSKRPEAEWLSGERTLEVYTPPIVSYGAYEVY